MGHVLHPELLHSVPLLGSQAETKLESLSIRSSQSETFQPNISVVIRALNEAAELEQLLTDIDKQDYSGEVELIVVDNESTDGTQKRAKALGASVVTLERNKFTYPRSMNVGMEAASHDIVWLSVGHALPTTDQLFKGGTRNFLTGETAGAYGAPFLPNQNASRTERYLAGIGVLSMMKRYKVTRANIGVLAATSAMISKPAWENLGKFDERYETGGEDTALAKAMLEAGYEVWHEPLLLVHHSHGLGPIRYAKQGIAYWQTTKSPVKLGEDFRTARPHINFN